MDQNELISSDLKLRPELFLLIGEYHDVFTSDQCQVVDTFKIRTPNLLKKEFKVSA